MSLGMTVVLVHVGWWWSCVVEQLQHALRAHRGHVYGRLVVTEECFRGEDEWHKVHDVAWKDHPHLQKPESPPQPR